MKTRIIINGAQGKMGQYACKTIASTPDFHLVGQLTRHDHLKTAIEELKADIVIDLTRADAVYQNALTIIEAGARPVIGTSGLINAEIDLLKQKCEQQQLGGLIVPNFSVGAVLMMHFASEASKWFQNVEIIEAHHPQKLDAPSGTALKTAELIAKNRTEMPPLPIKEIIPGTRGGEYRGIPIHSMRLPGILARQDVIFGETGETLTITHNSIDRSSFMTGLVLACRAVLGLSSLEYGLETVLFSQMKC
jgi:4-hydroxy-tetrahydrodipicolinate reductase